ncbi:ferredoxin reductase [Nocardia asteroides]|uniref:ferredoxin reductase n=1 Tax=Nocardia asteroides TaxID=1824 RepID=UPI001E604FBE|nr:ferredoxin reductase [Nocardia asteroides]UGT54021.1 ferredoxin reductase [Nocardia asteroides]
MVGLIDLVQTLTTPHPLDRYLELVSPARTARELRAEVTHVSHAVPDSVTLTLRASRQWRGHAAGQYVQIGVSINGVRHTRCYSPIDPESRGDRFIQLTVRRHPGGLVSNYLHEHAKPGMVVDLAPAAGVFALPERRPDRVLLISGGSGITPVLSMLRTLDAEGFDGEVTFLHYARSPELVPHRAELTAITNRRPNVRVEYRYPVEPGTVVDGETSTGSGFFDYDELERVAPWFAGGQTFVCGPPPLMRAVRTIFEAEGLEDRVHSEEFTLTTVPTDPAEATGTVTFSDSAVAADNTGASLLEQAESAGLTPEYGCRMGICFSCTATKVSGCTRNLRTGELDADPDKQIQICVNTAVGDVDIAL